MTFVSSFRPHAGNAEYALNQNRAIASWRDKADRIILFGDHEPDLALDNVLFVPSSDEWPTIKEMVDLAAKADDVTCILNADIFVGPTFGHAVLEWKERKGQSAISRRYQYEPSKFPKSLTSAKVVDEGFDFFMATQPLWEKASSELPETMWIGHCLWDNWMLGFLATNAKQRHFNMTRFRFLFHPRHGNRNQPMRVQVESAYIPHQGWGVTL